MSQNKIQKKKKKKKNGLEYYLYLFNIGLR